MEWASGRSKLEVPEYTSYLSRTCQCHPTRHSHRGTPVYHERELESGLDKWICYTVILVDGGQGAGPSTGKHAPYVGTYSLMVWDIRYHGLGHMAPWSGT